MCLWELQFRGRSNYSDWHNCWQTLLCASTWVERFFWHCGGVCHITWHQPNVWWGASTWLDCIKVYDKRVLWKSKHFVGSLVTSSGNWHTDLFEQVAFFCGHLFSSSGFSLPTTLLSVISKQLRQGSVGWQMVGVFEASDGSAQPCAPGWAWTWPGHPHGWSSLSKLERSIQNSLQLDAMSPYF